jgi:hypothetical protein
MVAVGTIRGIMSYSYPETRQVSIEACGGARIPSPEKSQ